MDPSSVPKPVPAVDVRSLPLAPVDGFILSRVDGRLNLRELSIMTGIPEESVTRSLEKLAALGAISVDGVAARTQPRPSSPSPAVPPPRSAPRAPQSPAAAPTGSSPPRTAPAPPSAGDAAALPPAHRPAASYTTAELEEPDVDLEMELRKRILDLTNKIEDVDHYALLNVSMDADKKAIKRAYFELAATFHPDKFFKKRLGTFKAKMEVIFGRITQAHDTLTHKERRAEYDEYLRSVRQTRGIEELMEQALLEVRRAEEDARRDIRPPSMPASPAPVAAPQPVPRAPATPSITPAAATPRHTTSSRPPADVQARRDALARRLMGGPTPTRVPPAPRSVPPAAPAQSTHDAMEALRRRYEDRLAFAHEQQAKKYAAVGHQARANKDVIAAANAFKVALSFAPDDNQLKEAYESAQAEADTLLSDSYQKQAQYEERSEHWSEAAKSWARVVKCRPHDARAHERAANALVKASGNLHEAADLAKRAAALDPTNAHHRVTLANVYVAAGLTLNARREVEAAAQLEPKNPDIQALLKRLQKAV